LIIIFFFSSRRRHTRWPRDWSSDVCSSDLSNSHRRVSVSASAILSGGSLTVLPTACLPYGPSAISPYVSSTAVPREERNCTIFRSEERRVGKECRSRWSQVL